MIILEKIILKNFQKHSNLEIEFNKGVNIIGGASRTGKSCLRRAISWLIFNTKIDATRKEGTKKTSVKGFFSNGIILEKIRSESVNRYILIDNKKEPEIFDSIGKEIPQRIKEALNLCSLEVDKCSINMNISEQITMPFLLDQSGSFRMKLFNLLTGNDLQDKLLGNFNKSILNIGRQLKAQEENLVSFRQDLIEINKKKEEFKEKVNKFKLIYEKIKNTKEKLDKLSSIKNNLEMTEEDLDIINSSISNLKLVDIKQVKEISGKIDKYNNLKSLRGSILSNDNQIVKVRDELKVDHLTEIDSASLTAKINRLDLLKSSLEHIKRINKEKASLIDFLEEIQEELDFQRKKYKELLKEAKICPTCNNPIDEKCLKGIEI